MTVDPIVASFDALVRRDASAPLVASIGRAASRADVDDASRQLARLLEDRARGSYLLVAAANGAGFLACLLGARRAGLVPVLADRSAPAAELERIAGALGIAAALVCDEPFPRDTSSFRATPFAVRAETPPWGDGYVKLTSGSSGIPSGVAVAPEALAADDDQLASSMGLRADDRILAAIPWSHSYGLSSAVLPALRRGSLLVVPDDGGPWAPLAAARAAEATFFPTVPVYLQTIATLAQPPQWPPSLRLTISAGAPLTAETALRVRESFDRDVHVFYGASECGGICYDREGGAALRGSVGTPVDGVEVALSDDDADEATIVVRSRAAGRGYVPFADARLEAGRFRSADRGAWRAGGELALLGRADRLINAGGKKVDPSEVEAVLREMPGVREAVVVGVRPEDGLREIVRAVVAGDVATIGYGDVVGWCRARLAAHKVPRSVLVVEAIPRTARGKIDRAALAGTAPVRVRG